VELPDIKRLLISSIILVLLSFAGSVMIVVRSVVTGQLSYLYLIWNLFLAWIPLILAVIMLYRLRVNYKRPWILTLLGLIWLVFYPNAPYMITDFIHIRRGENLLVWYDFVTISLLIITAFIIGFLSLYLVHRIVARVTKNNVFGWMFAVLVQLLSGFGIYLGRVKRWNSWDALFSPMVLLNGVLDSLHYRPLIFSLLFGMFLILTYIAVYSLTVLNMSKAGSR
jgi:uncharacterized membrane protein